MEIVLIATENTTTTFFYENWIVIKQLIWVFGKLMSGIMYVLDKMNIYSIAVAIVLFVVITKMLLLPMTVNQQKSMRISMYIQPELRKIQEKYRGRSDQASQQKMMEEQQAVQQKYGVSMMSGCLPLLIQFPILFALYPVIYHMDTYVEYLAVLKEKLSTEQLTRMYQLFGISLEEAPGFKISWALIIPVLVVVSQFLSTRLISAQSKNSSDPSNSSMKVMNTVMPLMMGFFAIRFPAFLGWYWAMQSLFTMLQQLVINHFLNKIGTEELIRRNIEKKNKKRAKKGLPPLGEKATRSTRSIKVPESVKETEVTDSAATEAEKQEKIRRATEYYNSRTAAPGSLAAKANMVREYNERKKK